MEVNNNMANNQEYEALQKKYVERTTKEIENVVQKNIEILDQLVEPDGTGKSIKNAQEYYHKEAMNPYNTDKIVNLAGVKEQLDVLKKKELEKSGQASNSAAYKKMDASLSKEVNGIIAELRTAFSDSAQYADTEGLRYVKTYEQYLENLRVSAENEGKRLTAELQQIKKDQDVQNKRRTATLESKIDNLNRRTQKLVPAQTSSKKKVPTNVRAKKQVKANPKYITSASTLPKSVIENITDESLKITVRQLIDSQAKEEQIKQDLAFHNLNEEYQEKISREILGEINKVAISGLKEARRLTESVKVDTRRGSYQSTANKAFQQAQKGELAKIRLVPFVGEQNARALTQNTKVGNGVALGSAEYFQANIINKLSSAGMGCIFEGDTLYIYSLKDEANINNLRENGDTKSYNKLLSSLPKVELAMPDAEGNLRLGDQLFPNSLNPHYIFSKNGYYTGIHDTYADQWSVLNNFLGDGENSKLIQKLQKATESKQAGDIKAASRSMKNAIKKSLDGLPSGVSVANQKEIKNRAYGSKNSLQKITSAGEIRLIGLATSFLHQFYKNTSKYQDRVNSKYELDNNEMGDFVTAFLLATQGFADGDYSMVPEEGLVRDLLSNDDFKRMAGVLVEKGIVPRLDSLKEEAVLTGNLSLGSVLDLIPGGVLNSFSTRAPYQISNYIERIGSPFSKSLGAARAHKNVFADTDLGKALGFEFENTPEMAQYRMASITDSELKQLVTQFATEKFGNDQTAVENYVNEHLKSVHEGGVVISRTLADSLKGKQVNRYTKDKDKIFPTFKKLLASKREYLDLDTLAPQTIDFSKEGGLSLDDIVSIDKDTRLEIGDVINEIKIRENGEITFAVQRVKEAVEGSKLLGGDGTRGTARIIPDDLMEYVSQQTGMHGAQALVAPKSAQSKNALHYIQGRLATYLSILNEAGRDSEEAAKILNDMSKLGKIFSIQNGKLTSSLAYDQQNKTYTYKDSNGKVTPIDLSTNGTEGKTLIDEVEKLGDLLLGDDYDNTRKITSAALNLASEYAYFDPVGQYSADEMEHDKDSRVKYDVKERRALDRTISLVERKVKDLKEAGAEKIGSNEEDQFEIDKALNGLNIYKQREKWIQNRYGKGGRQAQKLISQLNESRNAVAGSHNSYMPKSGNVISVVATGNGHDYEKGVIDLLSLEEKAVAEAFEWENNRVSKEQYSHSLSQIAKNMAEQLGFRDYEVLLNLGEGDKITGLNPNYTNPMLLPQIPAIGDDTKGYVPSDTDRLYAEITQKVREHVADSSSGEELNQAFDDMFNKFNTIANDNQSELRKKARKVNMQSSRFFQMVGANTELTGTDPKLNNTLTQSAQSWIEENLTAPDTNDRRYRGALLDSIISKQKYLQASKFQDLVDTSNLGALDTGKLAELERSILNIMANLNKEGKLNLYSHFHRYPSTSGTDIRHSRIQLTDNEELTRSGAIVVPRGIAYVVNADYDGDKGAKDNIGMYGSRKMSDKQIKNELAAIELLTQRDDAIASKAASYDSEDWGARPTEKEISNNFDREFSKEGKAIDIATTIPSKMNKKWIGFFSNINTNFRNFMQDSHLDNTFQGGTKGAQYGAIQSFFEMIEQDALSSKKLKERALRHKADGMDQDEALKTALTELNTLYKLLYSGQFKEAVQHAQNIGIQWEGSRHYNLWRAALEYDDPAAYSELEGKGVFEKSQGLGFLFDTIDNISGAVGDLGLKNLTLRDTVVKKSKNRTSFLRHQNDKLDSREQIRLGVDQNPYQYDGGSEAAMLNESTAEALKHTPAMKEAYKAELLKLGVSKDLAEALSAEGDQFDRTRQKAEEEAKSLKENAKAAENAAEATQNLIDATSGYQASLDIKEGQNHSKDHGRILTTPKDTLVYATGNDKKIGSHGEKGHGLDSVTEVLNFEEKIPDLQRGYEKEMTFAAQKATGYGTYSHKVTELLGRYNVESVEELKKIGAAKTELQKTLNEVAAQYLGRSVSESDVKLAESKAEASISNARRLKIIDENTQFEKTVGGKFGGVNNAIAGQIDALTINTRDHKAYINDWKYSGNDTPEKLKQRILQGSAYWMLQEEELKEQINQLSQKKRKSSKDKAKLEELNNQLKTMEDSRTRDDAINIVRTYEKNGEIFTEIAQSGVVHPDIMKRLLAANQRFKEAVIDSIEKQKELKLKGYNMSDADRQKLESEIMRANEVIEEEAAKMSIPSTYGLADNAKIIYRDAQGKPVTPEYAKTGRVNNRDVSGYITNYKRQLATSREIERFQLSLATKRGQDKDNTNIIIRNLQQQLASLQKQAVIYDEINGTLNGQKLTEEQINRIKNERIRLDREHVSKQSILTAQAKEQQGLISKLWTGMANHMTMFIDTSLAYQLIGRVRMSIHQLIELTQQLDANLVNIQIASGASRDEIHDMLTDFNSMASQLGRTTNEVATAANDWLRAGYRGKEASELTQASMMLSTLGMIESADATSYLISTLKGWKLSAEEVVRVVDKLTAVDMAAAISAGDLASAMSRANNSARMAGVDMDEFIGYVTTVADITQKTPETVGESFKTIFSRFGNVKANKFLATDLDKTASDYNEDDFEKLNDIEKVLSRVGITLRTNATTWKEVDDVMAEIGTAWGDWDMTTKNAVATAVAGTRQRENVVTLFENWDQVEQYAEIARNSYGTATEKMKAYSESVEAARQRFTNAVEKWALDINGSDAVKGFYNALTFLTKNIITLGTLIGAGAIIKNFGSFLSVLEGFGSKMAIRGMDNYTRRAFAIPAQRKGFAGIGEEINTRYNIRRSQYYTDRLNAVGLRYNIKDQELSMLRDLHGLGIQLGDRNAKGFKAEYANKYNELFGILSYDTFGKEEAKKAKSLLKGSRSQTIRDFTSILADYSNNEEVEEALRDLTQKPKSQWNDSDYDRVINEYKKQSKGLSVGGRRTASEGVNTINESLQESYTGAQYMMIEGASYAGLIFGSYAASSIGKELGGETGQAIAAVLGGIVGPMIGQTIAEGIIAQSFGSNFVVALAAAVALAIGYAINRAHQKALESQKKIIEEQDSKLSSEADVKKAAKVYDELKSGVDKYGNNVTLTTEKYQEFLNAQKQITEIFPELINGYDKNGNALLNYGAAAVDASSKVKELIASSRELRDDQILSSETFEENYKNAREAAGLMAKDYLYTGYVYTKDGALAPSEKTTKMNAEEKTFLKKHMNEEVQAALRNAFPEEILSNMTDEEFGFVQDAAFNLDVTDQNGQIKSSDDLLKSIKSNAEFLNNLYSNGKIDFLLSFTASLNENSTFEEVQLARKQLANALIMEFGADGFDENEMSILLKLGFKVEDGALVDEQDWVSRLEELGVGQNIIDALRGSGFVDKDLKQVYEWVQEGDFATSTGDIDQYMSSIVQRLSNTRELRTSDQFIDYANKLTEQAGSFAYDFGSRYLPEIRYENDEEGYTFNFDEFKTNFVEKSKADLVQAFAGYDEAAVEKIKQLQEDVSSGLVSTQDELEARLTSIEATLSTKATAQLARAAEKDIQNAFPNLPDIEGYVDTFQELKTALESVASSYKALSDAQKEQAKNGKLTMKTTLELLTSNIDYARALEPIKNANGEITGGIKLRADAEKIMAQAQMKALSTSLTVAIKEKEAQKAELESRKKLLIASIKGKQIELEANDEAGQAQTTYTNNIIKQNDAIAASYGKIAAAAAYQAETVKSFNIASIFKRSKSTSSVIKGFKDAMNEAASAVGNSEQVNWESIYESYSLEQKKEEIKELDEQIQSLDEDIAIYKGLQASIDKGIEDPGSFLTNEGFLEKAKETKSLLDKIKELLSAINKEYTQMIAYREKGITGVDKTAEELKKRYYDVKNLLLTEAIKIAKQNLKGIDVLDIYKIKDEDSRNKVLEAYKDLQDLYAQQANLDDEELQDQIDMLRVMGDMTVEAAKLLKLKISTADTDKERLDYIKAYNDAQLETIKNQKNIAEYSKKLAEYQLKYLKGTPDDDKYKANMKQSEEALKKSITDSKELVLTTYRQMYNYYMETGKYTESQASALAKESSAYRSAMEEYLAAQEALAQVYMDNFENRVTALERRMEELQTSKPNEWASTWNGRESKVLESAIAKIKEYYAELEEGYQKIADEAYQTLIDHAGELTDEQVTTLTKKYNDAMKNIRDNAVSLHEDIKKYQESVYSALTAEIGRYKDQLNEQKDIVADAYDKEIKKLSDKNAAIERTNKLLELQQNLLNANKEKERVNYMP